MQMQEPTTLHIPVQGPIEPQAPILPVAWVASILPIVVGLVWLLALARRRAKVNPEEHAFRSLSRRMRLRRHQVTAVRACALNTRTQPIDVLLNERLLQQALHMD
jgi:hypothetical protein